MMIHMLSGIPINKRAPAPIEGHSSPLSRTADGGGPVALEKCQTCGKTLKPSLWRKTRRFCSSRCIRHKPKTDISGMRFGRLVAISPDANTHQVKHKTIWWWCRCDCGNVVSKEGRRIRSGTTKSCGCWHDEAARLKGTHHKTNHRIYAIWKNMRARCHNPNNDRYAFWGGRGIKVCDRWRYSFENFYADMGEPPSPKHSIDRKDNDGDYEPGNCRWATREEQANNTRHNINIAHGGQTLTLAQWARKAELKYSTLRRRLGLGWDFEKALVTTAEK